MFKMYLFILHNSPCEMKNIIPVHPLFCFIMSYSRLFLAWKKKNLTRLQLKTVFKSSNHLDSFV